MRRTSRLLSLVLFCCASMAYGHAQPPKAGTIVPGESVGNLRLGSTFSEFRAIFREHPGVDENMAGSMQDDCPDRSYHWIDLERDATGVYALFKGESIYQLSVQTPRFTLANGIGIDSSASNVEHTYPGGREYVLLGSGGEEVGGKNLLYWVDRPDGLAFELYWNKRKRQRLVSAITIFKKGLEYRPQGCISPPQKWQEVKKLALESNRQ
jgi:hypothetical protein